MKIRFKDIRLLAGVQVAKPNRANCWVPIDRVALFALLFPLGGAQAYAPAIAGQALTAVYVG